MAIKLYKRLHINILSYDEASFSAIDSFLGYGRLYVVMSPSTPFQKILLPI